MSEVIKNRYDFVVLFDCENGNPNGDPDAGNLPRIDPETQLGYVTDVCLKRKIRNYVAMTRENVEGYMIYISEGTPLNLKDEEAINYVGLELSDDPKSKNEKKRVKKDAAGDLMARDFMCKNYYDIRTFGAVMTTFVKGGMNCGQVTGPVQFTFAQSIDPIFPQEISITRMAVTTEKDAETKKNTIGKKTFIPYGLYRAEGFISANLAQKVTGFSEDDLNLLWEAITNMFENDHSASRGKMAVRELIVFKHSSEFGDCPSHKLFDQVEVVKKPDVGTPRKYDDYEVIIHENKIPQSVEIQRKDV